MRLGSALVALAGTAACSSEQPSDPVAEGSVFPNRRARIESNGHLLGYVANRQSDTVSVVDLDALVELAAVPVGRDPVDVDGPRHVLVDTAASALYVVLSYPVVADSPHAIANGGGPRNGYVLTLALDDLRPLGATRVAASSSDIMLSDDRQSLAVAHYDTVLALKNTDDIAARRAPIAFIDPVAGIADGSATPSLVPTCVAPAAVVFDGTGSRAFVACTGEDSLVVLDTAARSVLSRVPAGTLAANKPYALTRSPDATKLALSNQVAQTLVVFSASDTPLALATAKIPGVPFFAAWLAPNALLVPVQNPGGAVRIDVETGTVTEAVSYAEADCLNPSAAALTADGRVFLVCEGDHYRPGTVARLDPDTLAVTGSVAVGVYPDRLAVGEP